MIERSTSYAAGGDDDQLARANAELRGQCQ